tara:strand:- start:1800 stop:2027 length:228 start_codon:yes stop_codon:yes gene_type:complete
VGMHRCRQVPKQIVGYTRRILSMSKTNLKVLITDIERALAELKAEVYSDVNAYRIDSGDGIKSYAQINDEDGECD